MDTSKDMVTRRDTLRRLAALPFATLGLAAASPALTRFSEDAFKQCAASIAACWELSKSSNSYDLQMAFEGVSAYLPLLKRVVKESSQYRKAAANLVGQGALLQTMLGWHLQGLKDAACYAQEAVKYSQEAEDTTLLLATLDYLAWVYYYDKKSKQALETIEQSIPLLKQKGAPLPSRLLGGTYSTLALMRSKNGQSGILSLRQAAESFFSGKEEESHFAYMDYTLADLVLNDGMVHYQHGDYDKALDSLSQLIDPEKLTLKIPLAERSRIEALNIMALSCLKHDKKDKELSLYFWNAGIQGAKALQSEQRFNEAIAAYDIMEAIWPHEKDIKGLQPLTVHW